MNAPFVPLIALLDQTLVLARTGIFVLALVAACIATLDWLVRTRRINPFGAIGRFLRNTLHPLMAPVERRIIRAGGLPASAPWWSLAFVVLAGIVLISLLEFVRTQVLGVAIALGGGFPGVYRLLVSWTFTLLQLALLARVILSWVRVSPYSRFSRIVFRISEPVLRPLRSVIPPFGPIDVTPIVAWLLLALLEGFFLRLG